MLAILKDDNSREALAVRTKISFVLTNSRMEMDYNLDYKFGNVSLALSSVARMPQSVEILRHKLAT